MRSSAEHGHIGRANLTVTRILAPPMMTVSNSMIVEGDARQVLTRLPSDCVQCVVTSPPYWGLRDYGIEGQIGLEDTLAGFINTELRGVCGLPGQPHLHAWD
jgi:hypothetical protein